VHIEHDQELLLALGDFEPESFTGDCFRAARTSLDPTTFSAYGGRWSVRGGAAALYTSLTREGALAEMSFHWGQATPRPSAPLIVHRLVVDLSRVIRIPAAAFSMFGIEPARYAEINYPRTQQVGEAVAYLGFEGLIAPSARWDCDNLILFEANTADASLNAIDSEEVAWQLWAADHNLL
jgi:hypothetical protein